jgi:hypothetical protein
MSARLRARLCLACPASIVLLGMTRQRATLKVNSGLTTRPFLVLFMIHKAVLCKTPFLRRKTLSQAGDPNDVRSMKPMQLVASRPPRLGDDLGHLVHLSLRAAEGAELRALVWSGEQVSDIPASWRACGRACPCCCAAIRRHGALHLVRHV